MGTDSRKAQGKRMSKEQYEKDKEVAYKIVQFVMDANPSLPTESITFAMVMDGIAQGRRDVLPETLRQFVAAFALKCGQSGRDDFVSIKVVTKCDEQETVYVAERSIADLLNDFIDEWVQHEKSET